MDNFKKWKIADLISHLQNVKKLFGNLPVLASHDEEGNGFSYLGEIGEYNSVAINETETACIIWPFHETLEEV